MCAATVVVVVVVVVVVAGMRVAADILQLPRQATLLPLKIAEVTTFWLESKFYYIAWGRL